MNYSLTLHGPDDKRILGFDNSHPVRPARRGEPQDHRHAAETIKPYEYKDAAALLEAFWAAVDAYMEALETKR